MYKWCRCSQLNIVCVIYVPIHTRHRKHCCQKYASNEKKIQIKVVQNEFCINAAASAYVFPPPTELGGSKDWYISNIILYGNREVDSLSRWTLLKPSIISKNCSNKNCSEFNFLEKSQRVHKSISPRNVVRRLSFVFK